MAAGKAQFEYLALNMPPSGRQCRGLMSGTDNQRFIQPVRMAGSQLLSDHAAIGSTNHAFDPADSQDIQEACNDIGLVGRVDGGELFRCAIPIGRRSCSAISTQIVEGQYTVTFGILSLSGSALILLPTAG